MAYEQGDSYKQGDGIKVRGPNMSNPDVGPGSSNSGHMGTSTDDYGMGRSYRGNKYSQLQDKVNDADAKKIKRQMKDHGFRY